MRLLEARIPANCEIALHGDNHRGNPAMCENGLNQFFSWVMAKKNRYYVHMGDGIEATMTDHKYYRHDQEAEPVPLQQMRQEIEAYRPSRRRCLCRLRGNHEDRLHRFGDLADEICRQLKVPYGSAMAKLRLVTGGKQVAKMFVWHGPCLFRLNSSAKDAVQIAANQKAALKRLLERKAADCLVMAIGHVHRLVVLEPTEQLLLTDDGTDIQQEYLTAGDGAARYIEPTRRWYVATGSFLRSYVVGKDTYAEQYGYDPVELGFAVVVIRRGKVVEIERHTV